MPNDLLTHEDEVAIVCATITGERANSNRVELSADKLAALALKQVDAVERQMERPQTLLMNVASAMQSNGRGHTP